MRTYESPYAISVILAICIVGAQLIMGCQGDETVPDASFPDASLTVLSESAPVFELEQDVAFGLSGGVEDALARPRYAGIDEEGYVYIHDFVRQGVTELKRFKPTGEFDRLVLRGGEGPFGWIQMEYPTNLFGIWVENSASIIVWNRLASEILVFDMHGEMITRSSWAHVAEDFELLSPVGRYKGDFLGYGLRTEPAGGSRPAQFAAYLRIRGDGAVVDTIWSNRRPADWMEITDGRVRARPSVSALPLPPVHSRPFGNGTLLEVQAPEPLYQESGVLTLIQLDGSVERRRRVLSYEAIPIPVREVKNRMLDPYRAQFSGQALRTLEGNIRVPQFAAPVLYFLPCPDGSVWIRLAPTSESLFSPGNTEDFLVIDMADHGMAYRVSVPGHRFLTVDRESKVWMTMETDLGEPYVASFALKR